MTSATQIVVKNLLKILKILIFFTSISKFVCCIASCKTKCMFIHHMHILLESSLFFL